MRGGTNTDVMTHCRILGLDEQYLTDLAQYQCQAARLRARPVTGTTRGGRAGHQCAGQPPALAAWSLVDRWKQGRKSVSQVRFMSFITSLRILKTQISAFSGQIATMYAGL